MFNKEFLCGIKVSAALAAFITILGLATVYLNRPFVFLVFPAFFIWMFLMVKKVEGYTFGAGVTAAGFILSSIATIVAIICMHVK